MISGTLVKAIPKITNDTINEHNQKINILIKYMNCILIIYIGVIERGYILKISNDRINEHNHIRPILIKYRNCALNIYIGVIILFFHHYTQN